MTWLAYSLQPYMSRVDKKPCATTISNKMTKKIIMKGFWNSGSWYTNRDSKRKATIPMNMMIRKDCKKAQQRREGPEMGGSWSYSFRTRSASFQKRQAAGDGGWFGHAPSSILWYAWSAAAARRDALRGMKARNDMAGRSPCEPAGRLMGAP